MTHKTGVSKQSLELDTREKAIAVLLAQGYSQVEISKEFNLSIDMLNVIKGSALMTLEIQRLQARIENQGFLLNRRLQRVAGKAVDVLDNLLSIPVVDDVQLLKLQSQHAQEVLSKAGYGGTSNVNIQQKTQRIQDCLSPAEMEELSNRGRTINA